MKTMSMILTVLLTQAAFAEKTHRVLMGPDQFKIQAKEFLSNYIQNGELESIGDECSMDVEIEDGRTYIALTTAAGMKFRSLVDDKAPVKAVLTLSEDGSFSKIYKFGPHKELHLTHMDDAYEHATLVDGVTSLSCGVYY